MFSDLARDFGQPVMLWQVGVLLATLAIAWLLARVLRRALDLRRQTRYQTLRFGAESLNRAFFPLIGAVLVWLARSITGQFMHTALLDLALVPLFGIGLIYIVFFFARRVFSQDGETHPWLFLVEKIVSTGRLDRHGAHRDGHSGRRDHVDGQRAFPRRQRAS